jgi:putative membrane protein (TIGR04086 family)
MLGLVPLDPRPDGRGPLDPGALLRGVAVAAVVVVPVAVAGTILTDGDDPSPGLVGLFSVLTLLGLVLGAAVAARRQDLGLPLAHGLVTTLVLFVVLQVIRLTRRAVAGDDLELAKAFSNLLLCLATGTIGGLAGGRLRARGEPAA